MSTMPAVTPDQMMPPPPAPGDRSADNPSLGTPEQNQQAAGLTDKDKENLIEVMNRFARKWSYNHRGNVKRVSKVMEYIRDRQYVYWDAGQGRYIDPFTDSADGSQQGATDDWGYKYCNNVIQWLLRVFTATLSKGKPVPLFWPSDAHSDQDVRSSELASKAIGTIERQNNARSLLRQRLMYLFASGNYFRYTRWLRDSDRAGVSKEPVWTLEEQEVKPDRYLCSQCGAEVPAEQMQGRCPQCGAALDEGDFHEAVTAPVPKVVGMDEIPNGQVAYSLYNSLHIMVAPDSSESAVDPLVATPILKLDDEVDLSAVRASYPEAWDLLKQSNTTSTGGGDAEYARLARTRNFTSNPGRSGTMNEGRVTLTRCWMREWAFNILDDKEDAKRLQNFFPKGVKLVTVSDKFLEAAKEKLTDHWTWCGTLKGFGPYPPAVADPAMPFQDRINDTANDIHQYMDRLASPDVLANVDLIDVEAWNGQAMSGGGYKPVKPKKAMGPAGTLQSAFFQPEFHIDGKIFSYSDALVFMVQMLLGITPQTWGGAQKDLGDTFGAQKQALDTAMGILSLYWDLLCEEEANCAKLSVRCLAENATDDLKNPVKNEDAGGEDDKFKNDVIHIDDLQGSFDTYPDVDQGMPETAAEWRSRLQEVLTSKDNALTLELLQPMPNRRLAMKAWAPPGMEVPGQDIWNAVMLDIGELMQGEPSPPVEQQTLDPASGQPRMVAVQLPSVQPIKELYFAEATTMDIAEQAWTAWGLKNYHKISVQQPAQWDNFLLYGRLLTQFKTERQAQLAPPAPAGPVPAQA